MKQKELKDLRTKDIEEMNKLLIEKRSELSKVISEVAASKEKNLKKTKKIRHNISQILTLIREREIINSEKADNKKISETKEDNEKKEKI